MKKKIVAVLTVCMLMASAAVHAQTTVVVQRPGLLTGLVDTAEALLLLPFAVAEGVALSAVETADAVLNGTTTVYTTPAPAPVVVASPAPVYTAPAPVVVASPAPVYVAPAPVQTVTTSTVTTTIVRPAHTVVLPRRHIVVPAPAVRYRYR